LDADTDNDDGEPGDTLAEQQVATEQVRSAHALHDAGKVNQEGGAPQAVAQSHAAHATLAANADSFVAAVTNVQNAQNATSASAPAHVGWRTDTPTQRPSPQHV
jgi:flagellar biosynthesis protein FlhG